ncbi:hypothetical protein FJMB80055_20460 [Enterobacter hormaechei]|nr:hypothetical protein OIPHN069_20660 [Enterobacter hormaechei subsp. hoffmannii]BDI78444.1 hypothetical protein FJMB80001_21150 [Enterobacter hormaechei]GJJ94312.1 hypothetical protein TUM16654_25920 [Enterobacter cloacae]BDI83406.1 hypothetical protein FJMB80002_21140 [Enterobacter hormaechei]BDI87896.1 hypothetical protein FJMB80003_17040 [Enterobacter hormaechei]
MLARHCHRNASCAALDKTHSQPFLKTAYARAECRLCDAQLSRCSGKTARLGNCNECD